MRKDARRSAEYRAGIIAAAIYNVNRTPNETGKIPKMINPMIFFEAPEVEPEVEITIEMMSEELDAGLRMCRAKLGK